MWRSLGMQAQASLIDLYMERSGFVGAEPQALSDGIRGDPVIAVIGRA